MTRSFFPATTFALVLLLAVYGCNSPDNDAPATSATSTPAESVVAEDDHSGHDHGDSHADHESDTGADQTAKKTDMEKMTESLASFSPADRASALKQHFCPVTDEMLGTMGAPKKVDVNGQSVWICCDGCKDKLLADSEKYLAKITK